MTQHLELEVDKFGRVLLPKRVRSALNLSPGSKIVADLDGLTLTLTPQQPRSVLEFGPDGWPIIRLQGGQFPSSFDPVKDMEDERSAEHIAGW